MIPSAVYLGSSRAGCMPSFPGARIGVVAQNKHTIKLVTIITTATNDNDLRLLIYYAARALKVHS